MANPWKKKVFTFNAARKEEAEKANDLIILLNAQPSGIALVFSRYANGAVADTNFNDFFVSKALVAAKPGVGHMFVMYATPTFELAAAKYLYINDTTITGHANNILTGTSSTTGIAYQNNAFVLRYVIGI